MYFDESIKNYRDKMEGYAKRALSFKDTTENKYYTEKANFISDIRFFKLYLSREQKSTIVHLFPLSDNALFNRLFERYMFCSDDDTLAECFHTYIALSKAYNDYNNYDGNTIFTEEERKDIITSIYRWLDFDLSSYVYRFVGCSRQVGEVVSIVREWQEEVDKERNDAWCGKNM